MDGFIESELTETDDRPGVTHWASFISTTPPRFTLGYNPNAPRPRFSETMVSTTNADIVPGLMERLETYVTERYPDIRPLRETAEQRSPGRQAHRSTNQRQRRRPYVPNRRHRQAVAQLSRRHPQRRRRLGAAREEARRRGRRRQRAPRRHHQRRRCDVSPDVLERVRNHAVSRRRQDYSGHPPARSRKAVETSTASRP